MGWPRTAADATSNWQLIREEVRHMSDSILPQVKTVVFLMLENRSLDNLLGWLYSWPPGHGRPPAHVYPGGSPSEYDGLAAGRYSNPAYTWSGTVKEYPVVPVPTGLGSDQDRVPAYDPYEEMKASGSWKGVLNQLFGDQDVIPGLPVPGLGPARMRGFLQDYYSAYMIGWKGLDIVWTYPPDQLPVINSLARKFAVSDRWFCSVPSQTNPNRAFSLCGTSLGRESNENIFAVEQFDVPTVINYLAQAGKTWGLYFTDKWNLTGQSYTEYTFPQISSAGGEFGTIAQFLARAGNGTLPDFTYLEPAWGFGKGDMYVQGTDYHPPTHLLPGEKFLREVCEAVRQSPQWSETLLIVTFDEHGGTYDHVGPAWGAINPDQKIGKDGFQFDLVGARVPTLLISPFVQPSTVFRAPNGSSYPFDHTSFIKTLLLWAGIDLGTVDLGKRMSAAPTFENVLELDHVNTEKVELMAPLPDTVFPTAHEGDPPGGAGRPLNVLFEGIGFAATKAIIESGDIAAVHADIERYHQDPEKFESALSMNLK
jgi:phospholipase C